MFFPSKSTLKPIDNKNVIRPNWYEKPKKAGNNIQSKYSWPLSNRRSQENERIKNKKANPTTIFMAVGIGKKIDKR